MSNKLNNTYNIKELIKQNLKSYSMFIILMLIMVIFGPLCGWTNFNGRNITYIFFQFSYVFILATGMVQCIIICGIDLSVGSVVAFVGAISVMIYNTGVGMFVTIIASLIMGIAVGAFQGWFIAYPKIPPFIATLAGMLLFRGLTYIVTKVSPVNPHDDIYSYFSTGTIDYDLLHMEDPVIFDYYPTPFIFALIIIVILWLVEFKNRKTKIAHGHPVSPMPVTIVKLALFSILLLVLAERFASYLGLPIVVIVLLVTVGLFHFIMKNTVLGRYIYAVGGNERSAKLSGINTELVTFIVYCIMGALSGLAAVVSTGYMNSALPQAGNMFEMDAIAACYIGGVSATGGIGTVVGVVIGGLIMSAINNGMTLMNLGAHYQYVVKALVVLLAVFYDVYSRRKAGLG
ncbi:ABC transporter permease subunit [Treponema sp. R80B11-R83G3]